MSDSKSSESSDDEGKELFNQDPDLAEDFGCKEWPFMKAGGLDDIPMPNGSAYVQLNDVLGKASEHSGGYSFGGLADQLPAVPGIFVDGIGPIPVPLWEERAQKLIEKCEKSPFGHNFDTKMDENVRKSWQLSPDQVQFKNPQWRIGIEKMTTIIGDQLGYQNVPLQCVLYKLLVYEEGGHFIKHQDTEKEDGMIATLVIQPPSLHEGGNLLVYGDGEVKHRHDFGKSDGTATYLPHFAVHYADAEHAVEKVTKGYRLVLVYSVCLPSTICHLEKNPNIPLARELADIIETMGSVHNSFALLLSHEYTHDSIRNYGTGALKGVDRTRFLALEEANVCVSDEKKLNFMIAKLNHNIEFYGGRIGNWNEESRHEEVTWHTTDGKCLGPGDNVTVKFNFLNPNKETYSQHWKPFGSSNTYGYTGNEGPGKNSVYARYAIIAWPVVECVENMVKFINMDIAFRTLQSRKQPPDVSKLRTIMDIAAAKVVEGYEKMVALKKRDLWSHYDKIPVAVTPDLFQTLCRLLENYNDPALVSLLFRIFFKHLSRQHSVTYDVAKILKKYEWSDIGPAFLEALRENGDADLMDMPLTIASELSRGEAQTALLKLAMEKTVKTDGGFYLSNLCGLVLEAGDDDILVALLKFVNPRLLERTSRDLSRSLTNLPDDRKVMVVILLRYRSEWLASQIGVLEKPFTWEMPVADFPDNAHVEAFLRGSNETMSTKGIVRFKDLLWGATEFAQKYTNMQEPRHHDASFDMLPSFDRTYVTIRKTRSWYENTRQQLPRLKEELTMLTNATTNILVAVISESRKNK